MEDRSTVIAAQESGPPTEESFRLIYRSRNRIAPERRKAALGALFTGARAKNKKHGITGALLVNEGRFVQTLEGDEVAVRSLYSRIEKDPRHDYVEIIAATPVGSRVFGRWSMAEVGDELGEPDTFLIAHKDGIGPAASLRPTPEQEKVLDLMRSAARGETDLSVPTPEDLSPREQRPARVTPISM